MTPKQPGPQFVSTAELDAKISHIPDDYTPRLEWTADSVSAHDDEVGLALGILFADMPNAWLAWRGFALLRQAMWQRRVTKLEPAG